MKVVFKINKKFNDKELENVNGGSNPFLGRGEVCPINGKFCKHGMISATDGTCIKAGIGVTSRTLFIDENGNEVIGCGETYYKCDLINNQE